MCGFGRKGVTQKEVYNIKPFVLLKGHFHLIFGFWFFVMPKTNLFRDR